MATIIGFGPFCVLLIVSHPGFCRQTCLFVCSGAACGHHHWVWPLLCFINCKSPRFLSAYTFVCLFVMGLLVATIIGFGPFCVLLIVGHPGFCRQTFLFVCSGAAGVHHHWVWPLLCSINCKSPRFLSAYTFVCLLWGCWWPPSLGLAPSVFYSL